MRKPEAPELAKVPFSFKKKGYIYGKINKLLKE